MDRNVHALEARTNKKEQRPTAKEVAQNRQTCKINGDAYIQKWMKER